RRLPGARHEPEAAPRRRRATNRGPPRAHRLHPGLIRRSGAQYGQRQWHEQHEACGITMRIADLTSGVCQLRDATESLQRAWSNARESWRALNSRNLEENHLGPRASEVTAAFPVIHELAAVLAQAECECGPW